MQFVLLWDNAGNAPAGWASHIMLRWCDWEPKAGQYDYALVERALSAAERPCYLQIGFSMYNKTLGAPEDYTPAPHRHSLTLTAASGKVGYVPDYSAAWVDALCRATGALAARFKGHPQVRGFWPALGWDQESQVAVNNAGGEWATLVKPKLAEQTYLDFLLRYGRSACDAWTPLPVYLPGTTSPGAVWGHRRRDVIATLLAENCGYMNCALLPDHVNSFGIGEYAGTGMYDIVIDRTHRVGFEEGPRLARGNDGELYWMLLRALHWGADFVAVYGSLSAAQVPAMSAKLPTTKRWFVWRDAEHAPVKWTSSGKLYGTTGEPGPWGYGLEWIAGGKLAFDAARYDAGRWILNADADVEMFAPGLPDGIYEACVVYPSNESAILRVVVRAELFVLPAGSYHRIDLREPALRPEPLPNDEPAATATKVRWWSEELLRQWDAGHEERARAILVSLIELAYRLEDVVR